MKAEGTALVTGASRGLGRAIALELARRGFAVHATMRDPRRGEALAEQARREGARLVVAPLDVTRPETIAIPESLRVVVNNAGVDRANLPVEHAPLALWREMFETNLFGVVEVLRRALPALRASGGDVVCNVTSCAYLDAVPSIADAVLDDASPLRVACDALGARQLEAWRAQGDEERMQAMLSLGRE